MKLMTLRYHLKLRDSLNELTINSIVVVVVHVVGGDPGRDSRHFRDWLMMYPMDDVMNAKIPMNCQLDDVVVVVCQFLVVVVVVERQFGVGDCANCDDVRQL